MDPRQPEHVVLVADDDRDVLELVASRLARSNFEVVTAKNGDEALSLALEHRPDVAVLDIVMPGRSGLEVTRELRESGLTDAMQVILLTARTRHEDVVRGFASGADDYVTKPFSGRDLDEHVSAAFERLTQLSGVSAEVIRQAQAEPGNAQIQTEMRDLLLAAVGEREGELRGHVEAVAEYAVPVGRRLGLTNDELRYVAYAAHLHDVGKLGIPEAVLEKAGPLDEREWRLMRKHTVIGERILRAAPSMAAVGRIVRSCHERWDGLGYPDGVAGEQIPLEARLIFVCDAYSAMTSRRHYSEPRTPLDALRELRDCAGSMFDPTVVEAFCAEAHASGWIH